MSIMWPAFYAALLGWGLGKAFGLPFWSSWNGPDQCDFAMIMAALVWSALQYLKGTGA